MRMWRILTILGLSVAAACQCPKIAAKEGLLTAAGFKYLPANTPVAGVCSTTRCSTPALS